VGDILDVNRLEASRLRMSFEPLDPIQTVQAAVTSLEHLAREAGIRVEVKTPDEPIRIVADEGRVHQVVVNLLSNAFKFSPRGGTVRVLMRPDKGGVRVGVRDEGCGIAASDQPRLFTKFTQLDTGTTRRASGAGLGLVISRAIVEAHGGRIWATSRLGEGSTFTFWLPEEPWSRREPKGAAGHGRNKKVLPGAHP
jgi:signal transduction histidine kinase